MSLVHQFLTAALLSSGGSEIFDMNSANFNGSSNFLTYPNPISVGLTDASYSIRVKLNTVSVNQKLINEESGVTSLLLIDVRATGNIRAFYKDSTGTNHNITTTTSPLSIDTWYTITATYDTSDAIRLYLDGALIGTSGAISNPFHSTSPNNRNVGYRAGTSSEYLDGTIASIRHWPNRVLSLSDVQEYHNGGVEVCTDDLSANLKTSLGVSWVTANWTGNVGQELVDENGSNDLADSTSIVFTGADMTVECS